MLTKNSETKIRFKKSGRVIAKLFALFLLLFLIVFLLLSIPSVQTYMGKYATNKLNKQYGTKIIIDKLGFQLNGDLNLKSIYIEDYQKDTLLYIQSLKTSLIDLNNILNNKLKLGDVHIEGLKFHLTTYSEADYTNLDVFVEKFDNDEPRQEGNPFLLSTGDLTVDGGQFHLLDYNLENPEILKFNELGFNTTDFLVLGPEVKMRINQLKFRQKNGLNVANLSCNYFYTPTQMRLENIKLQTALSGISADLVLDYKNGLRDFNNNTLISGSLSSKNINYRDLNNVYPGFGKRGKLRVNGNFSGTLNNLKINKLNVYNFQNMALLGNLTLKNVFSNELESIIDCDFNQFTTTHSDLVNLLPKDLGIQLPGFIEELGRFNITGTSKITPLTISNNIELKSELGNGKAQFKLLSYNKLDNIEYQGEISLMDFNLGPLFADDKIGQTTLNMNVKGKGMTLESALAHLEGNINQVAYNQYNYSNISISGKAQNRIFEGAINTQDPNANLDFKGLLDLSQEQYKFNFKTLVKHAELHKINLYKKDSISELKGQFDLQIVGSNWDNIQGHISIEDANYKNQNDSYKFKNFDIKSENTEGLRNITFNSPDIVQGFIKGKFKWKDIGVLVENSVGSIYSNFEPLETETHQHLDFDLKIQNRIATIINPDLELAPKTLLKGHIETDEKKFNLKFSSPSIKYKNYLAQKIELEINNANPLYNTFMVADSIGLNYYGIKDFNFINSTKRDTLFVKTKFKGGKKLKDNYDFNLFYTINQENFSVLGMSKSNFTVNQNKWTVNEQKNKANKIVFSGKFDSIYINDFAISNKNQISKLYGHWHSKDKNLHMDLSQIKLENIIPDIEGLVVKGDLTGNVNYIENETTTLPKAELNISNLELNDELIDQFHIEAKGKSLTYFDVDLKMNKKDTDLLQLSGFIDTQAQKNQLYLDGNLNAFSLKPINPFLEGVLSKIRGELSGPLSVRGRLNKPLLNGDMHIKNGGLAIDYLNVDYAFENQSKVVLEGQQFQFENIKFKDIKYNSSGILDGILAHNNFLTWNLDLKLEANSLLVLDKKESLTELYYGTVFMDGTAHLKGPASNLVVDVIGTTAKGSVFYIPLNDFEQFGNSKFIRFVSPAEKFAEKGNPLPSNEEIKGLSLNFDLTLTQDAEIEIVVDPSSGSTVKAKGEGSLEVIINTEGEFKIWGDYSVFEGVYKFKYNLIDKEFVVTPGSTLSWNGDPLNARINLEALYKTNANPSLLLESPVSRSVPVELLINLTGPILELQPEYEFNFPTLSSSIKSELDFQLSSKEAKEYQAILLLVTGGFAGNLRDVNFSGTLSESLDALINNLLGGNNDKFQLGFDVEIGQSSPNYETSNRVGLNIATQISPRLLLNGKVGVPFGSAAQSTIAGEFQIDWLLNEKGSLRVIIFNREDNITSFAEEIGLKQGLGISYSVDFNTFKELIQKIIYSAKKQEELKEKENPKN